jgi:hypothetical protein
VLCCRHGATGGLEGWGYTEDQLMVAVQGSLWCPPHLHTYIHIYNSPSLPPCDFPEDDDSQLQSVVDKSQVQTMDGFQLTSLQ